MRRRPLRSSLLPLAAVALACLAGCDTGDDRPREPPPGGKVAIVGWDGATWDVIDPLIARGELPHLAGLLENGGRAILEASPPLLSPVLWTTLATGFDREQHGILHFQMPPVDGGDEPILAATFHRRRAPLWLMASAARRTVGFVGWWTTWPAERVQGYMVSDHLAYNRWDAWARRPEGESYHLTFPPGLADELASVAVRPESLDPATLTALAPFNDREVAEMMAAEAPVKFHAPSVLRYGYATDASNAAFATHLLDTRDQPDLFATVFVLSDVAGHVFWHNYQPERFRQDPDDARRLAEAVPNVYRQLDAWTGEILRRLDPDTTVIVLSDHGMRAGRALPRPGLNPSGDHHPDGIFAVRGPGVPARADLGRMRSIDVTPTVLARLGLPLADDMPGRPHPLLLVDGHEPATIPGYGDGRGAIDPDVESPGQEELLERLRSLGYVGD